MRALQGGALIGLVLVLGCQGPRKLETRVGNRTTEVLQARAERGEGGWQVALELPVGNWRVEPQETQSVQVVPGESRSTLHWTVSPDRWSQQDRPFYFNLVGPDGLTLALSVKYPNTLPLPHGVQYLLANIASMH